MDAPVRFGRTTPACLPFNLLTLVCCRKPPNPRRAPSTTISRDYIPRLSVLTSGSSFLLDLSLFTTASWHCSAYRRQNYPLGLWLFSQAASCRFLCKITLYSPCTIQPLECHLSHRPSTFFQLSESRHLAIKLHPWSRLRRAISIDRSALRHG